MTVPSPAHAPDLELPAYLESELAHLPLARERAVRAVDRALRGLNRWLMVPALRLGLGAWLGTPFGGYILLLRVRGRRTGIVRDTPLSYLVADGAAWVLAGFGTRTQWYRNLVADPTVDVWLPGRTYRCRAEVAGDDDVRRRILPRLVRNTGAPALLIGCDPWRASDDRIVELLSGVPLIRLAPLAGPIAAGPDDPGGSAWIWRQGLAVLATLALGAALRRLLRGQPGG
jgi:deazaflavin-dependent oxidoreductase (nitroreductase family)